MRVLVFSASLALCSIAAAQLDPQLSSAQQPNPCDTELGRVGDVSYCDRYWLCEAGQPQLYDCPNGLVYLGGVLGLLRSDGYRNPPTLRGVSEGCDHPWKRNYCEGKQTANGPIPTAHCEYLYGIFGHETSCRKYYDCWNGTANEITCSTGLLFSEEEHACTWPSDVKGCQKHPTCKNLIEGNGKVAMKNSCSLYWLCQGGYPRLLNCPATLVFSAEKSDCVPRPIPGCPKKELPVQIIQQEPTTPNPNHRRGQRPNRPKPVARPAPARAQAQQPRERPQQQFQEEAQQFQEEPQQFQEEPQQFVEEQFQEQPQLFEEEQLPEQQFIEEAPQVQRPQPTRILNRPRLQRPRPVASTSGSRRPPIAGATPVRN